MAHKNNYIKDQPEYVCFMFTMNYKNKKKIRTFNCVVLCCWPKNHISYISLQNGTVSERLYYSETVFYYKLVWLDPNWLPEMTVFGTNAWEICSGIVRKKEVCVVIEEILVLFRKPDQFAIAPVKPKRGNGQERFHQSRHDGSESPEVCAEDGQKEGGAKVSNQYYYTKIYTEVTFSIVAFYNGVLEVRKYKQKNT